MKNLHILPTDKFQNIKLSLFENKLYLGDIASTALPQQIYITSEEEMKKEDWCYSENFNNVGKVTANPANVNFSKGYNKVILTTDQDLIKDGVQAIDDEFLEWLVKNPSCESVEVIKECCGQCDERLCEVYDRGIGWNKNNTFYKIIIPKEEPKQETLEEITEQIQKDCHKFVDSIISKVTYQDATNTFLFMKLAELTLKLKKYE